MNRITPTATALVRDLLRGGKILNTKNRIRHHITMYKHFSDWHNWHHVVPPMLRLFLIHKETEITA